MYAKVVGPKVADITSQAVGGTGVFDVMMSTLSAHIKSEYQANRITGAEYAKSYVALTQLAMGSAVQFVLAKEQAYWAAQQAQIATVTARIALETARVVLNQTQFNTMIAQYNLSQILPLQKAGMVNDNLIKVFNLNNILPLQQAGLVTDNQGKVFTVASLMPMQLVLTREQGESQRAQTVDTRSDATAVGGLMLRQRNLTETQTLLTSEQANVQRAQTTDTRADLSSVAGLLLRQRNLYEQQIASYRRDSELKVGKVFADSWTIQKTVDEGLVAPFNFTNAEIDKVLNSIRINNNLGLG